MRTTLTFDDELFRAASSVAGTNNRSEVFRQALEALVERDAARRLAMLGGSDPQATVADRRRPSQES